MKHKIVLKVQMRCDKCRTKAMKIAAVESGVSSVQIQGECKDQVVVIGDEVDSVSLARSLRKKVGFATILSLEEVKETTPAKPKEEENVPAASISSYYTIPPPPLVYYQIVDDPNPDTCSIQ